MVNVPTVIIGKTQTGKTFRAFDLAMGHDGPVVFADVQWRGYRTMEIAYTLDEVIARLHAGSVSKVASRIDYRLDDYRSLGALVDYLLGVHRSAHIKGQHPRPVLLVLDEVWRVAPQWADANNPAVRIFTEGFQHGVIGLAISQWASQTSRLILGNAYEWYIFAVWPKDAALLAEAYRMELPDPGWAIVREHECGERCAAPENHRYWRYTGDWLRGDAGGHEERVTPEPGDDT